MKNKIVKLFSVIVLAIVALLAVSCKKEASFALKQTEYWLDRYEETVVELEKGDSSDLTWTSDDTTVVTVEDGKLIAQGKGKTTVCVTDGNKTEEIAVTVRNSGVKPKIGFTELNAYIGVETEIPEVLNYAGKEMETTIAYTLTLEDDSYLSVSGNTIKGLKLGEVKGTLSADWKGLKLSKEITFKIYESVYMTKDSDIVEIHNVDSKLGRAALGIHLFELEKEMSELIEYEIVSGEDCVRVENGTVYAKAEGQAEIVASYSKDGIDATASVQVIVLPNYVQASMVKPATNYEITYEKTTETVGGRQSDDMYAYCAGDTVTSSNCFDHRVANKDVDVKVMDLYRQGYRYFTFDVYYTSNENLMVGCHNHTSWLGVGNLFRLDYLTIISDGEITNRLEKDKWMTFCYDLKAIWEISYGLPANIFYFVNDAAATSYLMNVRYYLDDKFIPDENRVYEDKGDYVQATNDEFDIAVPVSKSYNLTTGEPAVVVTKDTVPFYAAENTSVGGRMDAYRYQTQKAGKDTNALVVSTSLNATYADGMWRMSQKGSYLAWDIYPQENSTITFTMNGAKKSFAVKVGETNVFEEESWFTVIKDGAKQSVLTANEWQTVVIAFMDNYDENSVVSNITFSVYEADVTTYVSNVRYYKDNSFIPTAYEEEKYAPYIDNSSASASLDRVETGSFKGAYEYVNASNSDGAVSFTGIKTAHGFFAQGYKFVKYHVYFASNVQSITVNATGENNFTNFNVTLNIGDNVANSGLYLFNADETRATTLEMRKWYTMYIPVIYTDANVGNPDIWFSINGGTQDEPAKAYIKYVTFEYAVNVPTLNSNSTISHLVSLEYQQSGDFAGSWKYVNMTSGGDDSATKNWGESGVHFSRVHDASTHVPGAFFKEGYKWVKADFYMTDSVSTFSIRFSAGKNNAYWIQNIPFDSLIAKNVYVTDLDGNRLNVIPANTWFTLYIPVDVISTDDNYYMVSVYTNGGREEDPSIAYVKNIEYLKSYTVPEYPEEPVETENVSVHLRQENGANITGMNLEKQTGGDFAGAYKYVNGQLGRAGSYKEKYGELGIFFNEIYNANLGYNSANQPFFNAGYQYLKFDFYAEDTVYSIDFRHGDSTAAGWIMDVKAGSTFTSDVFAIYDAEGNKVNKWTLGAWYTLVIKPVEGEKLCIQTNAQSSASSAPVMYVKNMEYLESYAAPEPPTEDTGSINTSLHLRQKDGAPITGMSLERITSGDFAGSYKYTNGQLGRAGTHTDKYGELGIFFNEIYNANLGYTADQRFFKDYQYVRLDFYVEASVYSFELRHGDSVSDGWIQDLKADTIFSSDIFAIYDANGNKVNKWTVGAWYTLVIKPVEGKKLCIQTNAQTDTSSAPVMYVKDLSYETKNPFAKTTLIVDTSRASLEYQENGDFAGAYKYTNTSLGRGNNVTGEAGVHFMEVYDPNNGYTSAQTFFNDGYQYITLDFYAEESVYSIDLQSGWTVNGNNWIEKITADLTFTSDIFAIYDANGEKVDKWTAGTWYTLVIKPQEGGTWDYPLRIQTNAENSASAAPVMYVKNATYSVDAPYTES